MVYHLTCCKGWRAPIASTPPKLQWYAIPADTNRAKLRAMIEELASTNQVIADAIHDTNR
jgi:hypothetical protein